MHKGENIKKLYDKDGNFFAEIYYQEKYFTNYSRHSHESFGLSIIKEGKIQIDYHLQEKVELESSKVAVFKPNQVHKSKAISLNPLGYAGLHIDLNWYKNMQKELFGTNPDDLDIKINIIEDNNLYEELKSTLNNIILNNNLYEKRLERIIIDILKKYTFLKTTIKQEEKSFLMDVEKYILDNLEEKITLEDIALKVGYTPSYITRIFKKEFGLTPHAYIINKRINKAKKQLQKSQNISLAQLSNEVGFYDQNHLNKVFKRMHAISPNRYMNENLDK